MRGGFIKVGFEKYFGSKNSNHASIRANLFMAKIKYTETFKCVKNQ